MASSFKKSEVKLKLLTDTDMVLIVKKGFIDMQKLIINI